MPKRVMSPETKAKMSEKAIGHSNRNLSLKGCFVKGQTPWNKGIKWTRGKNRFPMSSEWKRKLSESRRGKISWNKGLRGSKSHAWKGGKSKLSELIRNSAEYYSWRAAVYKRDCWTCQTCGYRGHGKDIEAHHIVTLKQLIQENWVDGISKDEQYALSMSHPKMFDISNGVTLCEPCHILTYKGKKK